MFLDYDRKGFDHPLVPFQINCYGRKVISQYGGMVGLNEAPTEEQLDPPSPMPWRCFDLGTACARVLARVPGGGAHCLVQLVACLSDAQDLFPLSRYPE
jgi:hypothetical protein